ncbi:hypothetical protein [Amycolatopsis albispora]|uniref:Uncharacterized protein n=1 Tax=Amycolatopsis albispora TaxID=1804986 RepID=A0A344LF24_9PSEU|nr:hypothetical protein [Amycolatopsis albispora]AXB46648.1 hypothetical protein A4R43_32900 [Amycolatopsis albispora]
MSPWVRASADAPAEVRVPAAGKAVWVKADGEISAPPAVVQVRSDDDHEPPSTWLVPSFELPPR